MYQYQPLVAVHWVFLNLCHTLCETICADKGHYISNKAKVVYNVDSNIVIEDLIPSKIKKKIRLTTWSHLEMLLYQIKLISNYCPNHHDDRYLTQPTDVRNYITLPSR